MDRAVISRRALATRLPLLAAAGMGLWLVRDRIPWPPPKVTFAAGASTGWIPLPRDADLIEMDAEAEGVPLRLLVDSGAQFSAIDRGLAKRLGLPQTALPLIAYGVSGKPDLTYMVRFDLKLPGLAISGLRAATLDLSRLAEVTGRRFSIILGRDMLKSLVLEADLPRDRAAFHAPAQRAVVRDATVVPLRFARGGEPTITVAVEGSPLDVLVDTGASSVLALSSAAARQAGLLAPDRDRGMAPSVSLGGVGANRLVTARTVEAAGVTLRDATVQVYEPARPGLAPHGLLGMGFLKRFRMTLDLPEKRLILTPPSLMLVPPA